MFREMQPRRARPDPSIQDLPLVRNVQVKEDAVVVVNHHERPLSWPQDAIELDQELTWVRGVLQHTFAVHVIDAVVFQRNVRGRIRNLDEAHAGWMNGVERSTMPRKFEGR